ncbi:hypothetical protein [Ktedonobacter sp. SOSP1-52]|uniref:hypothetical protein n=1 Tax=Ktedonobacter sp. SOSP1-52 TaxID=2778366 RepID=UPI0019158729|nr:hypothetical protein [Ktedonobacter sp. SOSP1-52]
MLSTPDAVRTTRLLLVCAPAGFGKSTLLAAWAHQQKEAQVAWFSLFYEAEGDVHEAMSHALQGG